MRYLQITYFDILITARQAFSWLTPLIFFVIVVCLFPMAIGTQTPLLSKIAPGIIWVAALLSILISIGNLFRHDADCGHLDLMLLSEEPLALLVLCKIVSFWITHCLPLILLSPVLGILLNLTLHEEIALIFSLLLGTPVFCALGSIGAALVVNIQNAGLLLPVLIMPLYIPVLIFGTGAMLAASAHFPLSGYFAIMAAILLLSLAFAPLLAGLALRVGVDQ